MTIQKRMRKVRSAQSALYSVLATAAHLGKLLIVALMWMGSMSSVSIRCHFLPSENGKQEENLKQEKMVSE